MTAIEQEKLVTTGNIPVESGNSRYEFSARLAGTLLDLISGNPELTLTVPGLLRSELPHRIIAGLARSTSQIVEREKLNRFTQRVKPGVLGADILHLSSIGPTIVNGRWLLDPRNDNYLRGFFEGNLDTYNRARFFSPDPSAIGFDIISEIGRHGIINTPRTAKEGPHITIESMIDTVQPQDLFIMFEDRNRTGESIIGGLRARVLGSFTTNAIVPDIGRVIDNLRLQFNEVRRLGLPVGPNQTFLSRVLCTAPTSHFDPRQELLNRIGGMHVDRTLSTRPDDARLIIDGDNNGLVGLRQLCEDPNTLHLINEAFGQITAPDSEYLLIDLGNFWRLADQKVRFLAQAAVGAPIMADIFKGIATNGRTKIPGAVFATKLGVIRSTIGLLKEMFPDQSIIVLPIPISFIGPEIYEEYPGYVLNSPTFLALTTTLL